MKLYKWILFLALSLNCYTHVSAQVVHKQLRKDILQEQKEAESKEQAEKDSKETEANKSIQQSETKPKTSTKKLKPLDPVVPIKTPYDQKTAKIIYLENADMVRLDQISMPDVQILNGHVRFRHEDAILTCDSAYMYRNTNSLDAFSNVKIV